MSDHSGKDVGARLMAPFVILLGVSLLLIYGAIVLVANRADAFSRQRETHLAVVALESRLSGQTRSLRDTMTLAQADQLNPTRPHERMLLLAADGRILWTRDGPQFSRISPQTLNDLAGPALTRLHASVAQHEKTPSGASFLWVGGEPMLALATLSTSPGTFVVDILDLNDLREESARRYELTGLKFVRPSVEPSDSQAAPLRLLTPTGQLWLDQFDLAADWSRLSVSAMIERQVMPVILGVTLLVVAIGLWLVNRARRLARSLVASETHAKHLALHDPMTGLANRPLFTDRLDHALEHRRRAGGDVAVVCIDLDRFKKVNDTLGHQAGDALIREAARLITSVCRGSDTVARLGGDEFALVLAPIDGLAGVNLFCERLTQTLTSVLNLPEGQATLSASIGVTLVSDGRSTGEDAMRQADLALYRAKADGRGCYAIFEPAMDESARLRRLVEAELRDVMDSGGLTVAYQPQYTAKGRMEGVEALVRWNHPVRGFIPPDQFIPIAEEAGLIDQLGEFVMRQAMTDAQRWPSIKVAINVSPLQLRRPSFADRCLAMATKAGIDPRRIELEITEGVLVENDAGVQGQLKRLREMGFRLALDDFGTGYSSLSYLNAYPVDKIKIDRSFVSNLSLDGEADKVVSAIIHLGQALGLAVTAEGVETEAQRVKLIAAGCNSLQGYLHGRPTDAAAIDALLGGKEAAKVA
ncbi:MAG: bifunctional diguanylate cyclase/phosphodiesterase [Caulobacteraceae bacterium]|nr:bifunctional diguanylate cyclase/phosphodiesterase [Caulobacteraceae bacterium]